MDYLSMTAKELEAEKNRLDEIVQSTRAEMRKIRVAQEPHLHAANRVGIGLLTKVVLAEPVSMGMNATGDVNVNGK